MCASEKARKRRHLHFIERKLKRKNLESAGNKSQKCIRSACRSSSSLSDMPRLRGISNITFSALTTLDIRCLFFFLLLFSFLIHLTIWLFVALETNPSHTHPYICRWYANSPKRLWPNLPTSVPCGESLVETAILKLSWLIKA